MNAKSPLARFFTPVGFKTSSPFTPAKRGAEAIAEHATPDCDKKRMCTAQDRATSAAPNNADALKADACKISPPQPVLTSGEITQQVNGPSRRLSSKTRDPSIGKPQMQPQPQAPQMQPQPQPEPQCQMQLQAQAPQMQPQPQPELQRQPLEAPMQPQVQAQPQVQPQSQRHHEPPAPLQPSLPVNAAASFTAECIQNFNTGGAAFEWPSWLRPENLRDKQGRRPTDPSYNQATLWIPDEATQKEEGHGTPMLKQFWKVKQAHFDKVALFKVGKFYEVFYYDAFIAQRECRLNWCNEKKPHVGFPEMAKHDYAKLLVAAGYKVVVVEQVERASEQKERNAGAGSCIEREPCEIFTKGTVVDPEMVDGASARFMAYLHFDSGSKFSVCLVDCATSQILLSTVQDAADRNALRTLLAQVQPSEVVYAVDNAPTEVVSMLRRLPCRPLLSALYNESGIMASRQKLQVYRSAHPGKLSGAVEAVLASESAAIAAAGAMDYLESCLLGPRVLPFAIWEILDSSSSVLCGAGRPSSTDAAGRKMVLDATALSALEILETLDGSYKGSLLEFLDNTRTPFGFRLLKQWLCAPLFCQQEILLRRNAVEFFIQHADLAAHVRNALKKIPVDLERETAKVWGYAVQAERRAVMYEDVTAKRLSNFMALLQAFEQCLQFLSALPSEKDWPERLKQITRTRSKGGTFPDLQAIITRLGTSVIPLPADKNGRVKYRPCDGVDKAYDGVAKQIAKVKTTLEQELKRLQVQHPKVSLVFVHRLPAFRFEVEAAEGALPEKVLEQLDVTSRLKGSKVRFQTDTIKQLVAELDRLDEQLEDCVFPFLSRLFQDFYAHQAQFRAAVRLLAELDALLSLAMASQGLAGDSCCPELVELGSADQAGVLELKSCRHPVAAAAMGTSFVPNDTTLNANDVPGVIVVTGPNMGGKSTVLRQTCIAVIMAQLGCRVNAAACRLSPVDRIFTRIGSYDALLEGKSTLLTELEETAAILLHASKRSLTVLDELGRGTSTFDGAAIAAAVLADLTRRVQCLVLFATHYHPVSQEASSWEDVAPFHMAAEVDKHTHDMTFLYRFLPGLCPASYGHNVARLAGLPQSVLTEARQKSAEFDSTQQPESAEELKKADSMAAELLRLAEMASAAGNDGHAADELRAIFRTESARRQAEMCGA